MIVKATAIPLSIHPYSSTSRVVNWLTQKHGKVSTLLKGALRPKSPFLGEYELFGTSELLYYQKRTGPLHTGKECALLHPRTTFRTDWRAMQTASYLSALFNRTTPEESPQSGLFELFENLLDLAEEHGHAPPFLLWAELRFCTHHGHAPNLGNCTLCSSPTGLRFCPASGGVVCADCSGSLESPTMECPPDVLAMLRKWQQAEQPRAAVNTRLSPKQKNQLNSILGTFMQHQFNLPLDYRNAACAG